MFDGATNSLMVGAPVCSSNPPIFSLVSGSTVEATGVIKKWPDASCTATCFLVVQGEPSTAALFFFDGF